MNTEVNIAKMLGDFDDTPHASDQKFEAWVDRVLNKPKNFLNK